MRQLKLQTEKQTSPTITKKNNIKEHAQRTKKLLKRFNFSLSLSFLTLFLLLSFILGKFEALRLAVDLYINCNNFNSYSNSVS